ncbi:DUF6185 family protein [Streptomyces sp. Tu102]|uniref:DUF6185 family protein n=1 Tax=Streptomyces sp. Tu102 TaxID=2838019 RepID=UPI0027E5AD44|nr:DUF6185 family protein [Streptomyces sp. Tu102]
MRACRGAASLFVLFFVFLGVQTLLWPAAGRAEGLPAIARDDGVVAVPDCAQRGLKGATGRARVAFDHDGRTYTKVTSDVTLTVPMSWRHADKLLFGPSSEEYRFAMRCLVRGDWRFDTRWEEWRSHEPVVRPGARTVTVEIRTHAWVDQRRELLVGPWTVDVRPAWWEVRFTPPAVLGALRWDTVVVDPGRPGVSMATPRATRGVGDHGLEWTSVVPKRPITVRIEPSWPRSWSAQDDSAPFGVINAAGYVLWDLLVAGSLWRAAVLYRNRHRLLPPVDQRVTSNLRNWAVALFCLSLLVNADNMVFVAEGAFEDPGKWAEQARLAVHAWWLSALAGAVLLLFARGGRRVSVVGIVLVVIAAVPGTVPSAVGLHGPTFVRPVVHGHAWYTVASVAAAALASFVLLVLGMWAAAWRLLRDGGLLRGRGARFPLGKGLALSVGSVLLIGVCQAVAKERDWLRGSWPSAFVDPTYVLRWSDGTFISRHTGYGAWHQAELRSGLLWSADQALDWWSGKLWVLTALAMLAFLHVASGRRTDFSAPAERLPVLRTEPGPVEQWLLMVSYPAVLMLFLGIYAANSTPALLWFIVDLAALAVCLRLGARRAVLHQRAGTGPQLGDLVTPADRTALLLAARGHRERLARLRRLDHGQSDDGVVDRERIEGELRNLRDWDSGSGGAAAPRRELPPDITVVDAVLALGPRDTWWDNGMRAARYAAVVSLPFAGVLTWSQTLRGDALNGTLYDPFGFPEVVWSAVSWVFAFAWAGFLLGALWRRLPGRRGPVKALPLAVAYAAPVGLFAVGNHLLGEEQDILALAAAAVLLVFTLTALAMDLDTFRAERVFWPSRTQLLLSVYQMRFFSLQIAWVLAQLVALVTLWQFFTSADVPPSGGGSVTK